MEIEGPGSLFAKAFTQASEIYKQSAENSFYVSTKSFEGLHLAILPPRTQMVFSEYRPGSQTDVDKVTALVGVKEFKSFYCSICTIEEPDNIAERRQRDNELQVIENPADEIHYTVSGEGGEQFVLTGTKPQYLYNHLLLSSVSHRSTYLTFLYKPMFSSLLKVIRTASQENPGLIAFFNGNFGSDAWHSHLHLTNIQKFSIIEKIKKDDALRRNGLYPYTDGVVKATVISGTDIDALYSLASKVFLNVFNIDFVKKYLAANIFFANNRFYIVVLYGNNTRVFQLDSNNTFFLIIPAYTVSTNSGTVSPAMLARLKEKIVKENIYEDISKEFRLINDEVLQFITAKYKGSRGDFLSDLPVEGIQYKYLVEQRDFCKDLLSANVLRNNACTLGPGGCSVQQFAKYKYLLSLLVFCYLSTPLPGEPSFARSFEATAEISRRRYEKMLQNPDVLNAIIAGEKERLKSYDAGPSSLYLSGMLAKHVVLRTFDHLVRVSSLGDNPYRLNLWAEYGPRIGEPSAYGVVRRNKIKDINNSEFVLKATLPDPGKPGENAKASQHELAVGLKMNDLRALMPNFVLTLGGFACQSPEDLSQLCTGGVRVSYIAQEYIKGFTMKNLLRKYPIKEFDVVALMLQVLVSTSVASNRNGFTHYDLHVDNVMLYPFLGLVINGQTLYEQNESFKKLTSGKPSNNVRFNYHVTADVVISVPAYFCAMVIDFGKSYVAGLRSYHVVEETREAYGMMSDESRPWVDVYGFLMSVFENLLDYRPEMMIEVVGGYTSWKSNFLVHTFFTLLDSYKVMFTDVEGLKMALLSNSVSPHTVMDIFHGYIDATGRRTPGYISRGVYHFRYIPPRVTVNDIRKMDITLFLGYVSGFIANYEYNWVVEDSKAGLNLFDRVREVKEAQKLAAINKVHEIRQFI